jgi:hypothetical protein
VGRLLAESGHEVTALASSGAYEGAAEARDQETKRPKDEETGDRGQGTVAGSEAGVAVGRCCGEAVNTEQPSDRKTEPPGPSGTLRVETVGIPKWMPRALAWLWFTWQARKRIPRMDWDVCVLMTDPPLLPLLAAKAASDEWRVTSDECTETEHQARHRNTDSRKHRPTRRVAVWLMDLYPEALAASGRLSESNPIYRWYFEKRQRALAASDLLVFLGETQKVRAQETGDRGQEVAGERHTAYGIRQTNTAVVPPWDDRGNIALATEGSLRSLALYAGNLGEAHCFEEILAAAPFLPGDWKVRFAVRGAKLAELKEKASQSGHGIFSHGWGKINTDGVRAAAPTGLKGECSALGDPSARNLSPNKEKAEAQDGLKFRTAGAVVHVSGYASEEETPRLLASARVHLITMSPGWEGIVVPSKLYGCIRTGRPVLFIGPENADTAREIRANDWGMVLPPGASGEKVAGAILELAARPTKVPLEQCGAREVAGQLQFLATDLHG